MNGREYSALALLATGVRQSALNKSNQGTPREGAFNVNGLRSTFNNFLIDGVDNNAYGTSNQGFSNQVMQPPPDAVGEFRVVTNNQSAEYGRAAGATVNVAYRSGTNQFHGDAWEFFRDTALNATDLLQAGRRTEAAAAPQPVRRRARRADREEQGVLLRRLRRLPPEPESRPRSRRCRRRRRTPAILNVDIRDPRTGVDLSGGHADSDDRVRAQGARRPAGAQRRPAPPTTIRSRRSSPTTRTRRAARSTSRRARRCRCSAATAGAVSAPTISRRFRCPRAAAATATSTRATSSSSLGATYVPTDQSLLEVRFGWSNTQGGKNPPALGDADTFGISGLPTDPRIAGGLPSQSISGYSALGPAGDQPAVAVPDRLESEDQLLLADGAAVVQGGLRVPEDRRRGAGRQPALRPGHLHRPVLAPGGRRPRTTSTTSPTSCSGLRSQYALSTFYIARDAAAAALHLPPGRHPRQRPADAERSGFATSTRRR